MFVEGLKVASVFEETKQGATLGQTSLNQSSL